LHATPKEKGDTMDKRSIKTLEFDKIIERLTARAISPAGKAMCAALLPMQDFDGIARALEETTQALEFSMKAGHIPLGGIKDIAPSLKRAEIGGILSVEELFNIGEFIYVCKKVLTYAKSVERRERLGILDEKFEEIILPTVLEREIGRCIQTSRGC